jgi:hypothetical protein
MTGGFSLIMETIMKYRVHVYATYRLPVEVEAESQAEAMTKAQESFDGNKFNRGDIFEYADEITAFLVDEKGDEEYANSRAYDAAGNVTA